MIRQTLQTLKKIEAYIKESTLLQKDLERMEDAELRVLKAKLDTRLNRFADIEKSIERLEGALRNIDVVRNEMQRQDVLFPRTFGLLLIVCAPRRQWGLRLDNAKHSVRVLKARMTTLLARIPT